MAYPPSSTAGFWRGSVDLSLVSSYFYLEHAHQLRPLPDFSVADLGPVYSVNLFHRIPWNDLKRIALTTESATSVRLLQYLLEADGIQAQYTPAQGAWACWSSTTPYS